MQKERGKDENFDSYVSILTLHILMYVVKLQRMIHLQFLYQKKNRGRSEEKIKMYLTLVALTNRFILLEII